MLIRSSCHLMLVVLVTALITTACNRHVGAETTDVRATRIHTKWTYNIEKTERTFTNWAWLCKGTEQIERVHGGSGSAFFVRSDGAIYGVTAAHVMIPGIPAKIDSFDFKDAQTVLRGIKAKVSISSLAWNPKDISWTEADDIAVFTIAEPSAEPPAYDLGKAVRPTIEMPVKIWGFSGSSPDQVLIADCVVTSIEPGYFSLNRPIDPGYSGGVILDARNRLVGVVTRSTERTTICRSAAAITTAINQRTNLIPYSTNGITWSVTGNVKRLTCN